MGGGKHLLLLLLLAVYMLPARCQQKPAVSRSPSLNKIYSGDTFYLSCDNSRNTVKWYFNNTEAEVTSKTWKIVAAAPKHSGFYQCESDGQKSESSHINIMEYIPRASLTIKTGQPVMRKGASVVLQVANDVEGGLQGWRCWVYRGGQRKRIALRLKNDTVSLDFQPRALEVPETIFWCTDRAEQHRSNQVIVRTSEKDVSLEMYHQPVLAGSSLMLRCLVWGTDHISKTVFYKGETILTSTAGSTYEILDVTGSAEGRYKCDATFTHEAHIRGPPYHVVSDYQELFVQDTSMQAVLSENDGLLCSCPLCPRDASYVWYQNHDEGQLLTLDASQSVMMPKERGTYACRAVWNEGRSFLSNSHVYESRTNNIVVVVVIVLVILGAVLVLAASYIWRKKRNTTGPVYEDVMLRNRDKGDDKYESLHGAQRGGEYDTLHPEEPGKERREGDHYQPLRKQEMKEGVYHTLGAEGGSGGTGGYEALRKEGMKEGLYHTLGTEGESGATGGYEALKKEEMKEGLYHTLGMEGTGGGGGI